MAIKVVCMVTQVNPAVNSEFYCSVRWAYLDVNGNSVGDIYNAGPFSPTILSATLESSIKSTVASALSVNAYEVRMIGATL